LRVASLLSCTTLFALSCVASQHRANQNPDAEAVLHGTINIALGNRQGAVLLTDSMLSTVIDGKPFPMPDKPGQKLFQIDDKTVCSIAGFVSTAGPIPDFWPNVGSIMESFSTQLAQQSKPIDLASKLNAVAMLMELNISAIGSLRAAQGQPLTALNYLSTITLVGYDLDGSLKLAQTHLGQSLHGGSEAEVYNESIKPIGPSLTYGSAGEPDVADNLFNDPGSQPNDTTLAMLLAARHADDGVSLTIEQMEEIARSLAKYSASAHRTVGGQNQIAIVHDGKAKIVEQETFPKPPSTLVTFALMTSQGAFAPPQPPQGPDESDASALNRLVMGRGTPIAMPEGFKAIIVNGDYVNVKQDLDGKYFYKSTFQDCTLTYNGGPFYFDKTNRIEGNTFLLLGAGANRNDPKVQALLRDHPWVRPTPAVLEKWHPPLALSQN
jgi:hypothetical protein